jgi:SAM-dependent methyltransferase
VVVGLRRLPRLDAAPPAGEAVGGADHPMRAVTREAASDPTSWTTERRAETRERFDDLAADWTARFGGHPGRDAPLVDALERGGPFRAGTALDLGSGTGLQTPVLAERFERVVAIDLSFAMLERAPAAAAPRVQADGAQLPLRSASVDVAVLVNALLFPAELNRVLAPAGVLVWVSSIGADTPIHLPADEVLAALGPGWDGVESEATTGTWATFHRT